MISGTIQTIWINHLRLSIDTYSEPLLLANGESEVVFQLFTVEHAFEFAKELIAAYTDALTLCENDASTGQYRAAFLPSCAKARLTCGLSEESSTSTPLHSPPSLSGPRTTAATFASDPHQWSG